MRDLAVGAYGARERTSHDITVSFASVDVLSAAVGQRANLKIGPQAASQAHWRKFPLRGQSGERWPDPSTISRQCDNVSQHSRLQMCVFAHFCAHMCKAVIEDLSP
jgi:hypothetical protein